MIQIGRTKACISVLLVLLLFFMISLAGLSSGQQGGVGVENDGPSFLDISVTETNENILVNVEVKDLNGWNDIFSINVTIYDNEDVPISQVNYMQYTSLSSTTVATISWNETIGNYLNRTRSSWVAVPVRPWNPDFSAIEVGLRVSFAFDKFSGYSINILAMDRGMQICEYNGPFSAEYTPAPTLPDLLLFEDIFGDNEAVASLGLSGIVAAAVAAFIVYRRYANNKFAKAVEDSHTASGED